MAEPTIDDQTKLALTEAIHDNDGDLVPWSRPRAVGDLTGYKDACEGWTDILFSILDRHGYAIVKKDRLAWLEKVADWATDQPFDISEVLGVEYVGD